MPHLYAVPPGESVAAQAAALMRAHAAGGQGSLAEALVLVPTRRSCVAMRNALATAASGAPMLLPRIMPLADIGDALLTLLGPAALPFLAPIPPAMPEAERRFLLTRQVMQFEKRRVGSASIQSALAMANPLMALQDKAARWGITLKHETLAPLISRDLAHHWKESLQFLAIITDSWPEIEQEMGMTTAATRETAALHALARFWQQYPPSCPVYLVGSTASQPATARLMQVIADSPQGHVVLPGLAPVPEGWAEVVAGHPLFHLKHFLDRWSLTPSDIPSLGEVTHRLWLESFTPICHMPSWKHSPPPEINALRVITTTHPEEEARLVTLLIREALEEKEKRVALITPDESFMTRVGCHLKRYGITPDRLTQGSLAETSWGSLLLALGDTLAQGLSPLSFLALLRHPLLSLQEELVHGLESSWRGVARVRNGELPPHAPELKSHHQYVMVKNSLHYINKLLKLSTTADQWVHYFIKILETFDISPQTLPSPLVEALEQLGAATPLGALNTSDLYHVLADQLSAPWRGDGAGASPQLFMLTPVEARLETFDRVILANLSDDTWPGAAEKNPWLSSAMQSALGFPSPEEQVSRMAHDLLVHGSGREVFLTHAHRKEGSPVARSRFIERLFTYLAATGCDAQALTAPHYMRWVNTREQASEFMPEPPIRPMPATPQRPTRISVTDMDALFNDPFRLYARYTLGLRKLKEVDAVPEASDFGSLAHRAIQALTLHWNDEHCAASDEKIIKITDAALQQLSNRPSIALFWRTRLIAALRFVNRQEAARRGEGHALRVTPENPVEGTLAGITLYGRIDRLEEGAAGRVIIDYKTGTPPSERDILAGHALQLLTYALLAGESAAVEYWQLPRLGEEGEISHLSLKENKITIEKINEKLFSALREMQDPATPFLTTPDERNGHDYDGISRYDEWAG